MVPLNPKLLQERYLGPPASDSFTGHSVSDKHWQVMTRLADRATQIALRLRDSARNTNHLQSLILETHTLSRCQGDAVHHVRFRVVDFRLAAVGVRGSKQLPQTLNPSIKA